MKKKWSEDTTIALRQMANELADSSIVNHALARYIYQILEFVHEEYIEPLSKENLALKERIKELEKEKR